MRYIKSRNRISVNTKSLPSLIGIDGEAIRDLMTGCVENRFEKVDKISRPIQWLTDNVPCYVTHDTVKFARTLGFDIYTTPSHSPESNGMAEAFVKIFKRDYLSWTSLRVCMMS